MKKVGLGFLTLLVVCSCGICLAGAGGTPPRGNQSDDAIAMLIDLLKSDERQMQTVAIAMVREMPGKEMTDALVKELPNLSVTTQVQLLSALGDRGDRAALPAVITAAKAADESVRTEALRALGQLGNASTVGLLAQTAAGASGDEQEAARESLYRLRGPAVEQAILLGMQTVNGAILAEIPKAETKTKVELISSVGQRNISAGVSTLLKTAKDSDREVRAESYKVLKVVAGPQHLPALVELLINVRSSSDRNEAEKTVAAVAHKIEDKNRQAEAVLAVLPSVKDVEKRSSLLSVLGKIGDSSALPCLREALDSDDVNIKGATIRALAEWPTSEPAVDLMKAAENSENKVHRILALRGYVHLLGLDNKLTAEETIGMYQKAMALAPDAGEKKRVLSGLANIKSLDALLMAADYLQDKTLFREAEFAVVKIAESIFTSPGPSPGLDQTDLRRVQQAKAVLTKIIQTSENDSLRQQAQKVINQIDGPNMQTED